MEQIRINRYLGIFTAALIAVISLCLLAVALTDYTPGGSVGLIQTAFASFFTGMLFVRDNKRLPTNEERRKLVWLSFIVSLLLVLIPLVCFLAYLGFIYGLADLVQGISEFMSKLPGFAWALIVIFTLCLSYLSIFLGYGSLTTQFGKYFLKRDGL
jgi:hypothetical protein